MNSLNSPPPPLVLDARSLTLAQRCPRRYALEAAEPHGRWNARSLFDANLRAAVRDLGAGLSAPDAAREACTRFRQAATNPGLEAADPWALTQDYCAALETSLEAAGRTRVPSLGTLAPVVLSGNVSWAVRAFPRA